ncbi:unnamed protein product, partial [Mesorhabditis belari]|uniref:Uncharacterized protein n=1 Tax=Mesorhabditis belari TaxID=2138241 RepID=A0AAF3ECL9_9BILA
MPVSGLFGRTSETHITNNTAYNIFANVKMLSKIDVFLDLGKNIFFLGKKDFTAPADFSKIVPRQTHKFTPDGSGKRIMEVCTAYLSIYIQMPSDYQISASERETFCLPAIVISFVSHFRWRPATVLREPSLQGESQFHGQS